MSCFKQSALLPEYLLLSWVLTVLPNLSSRSVVLLYCVVLCCPVSCVVYPSCKCSSCSSLSEVLEELEAIPARYRGPGDFIAEQLSHIDQQGQSFTRSTFEQRTEQRTVSGGGTPIGGHSAKQVEIKGHVRITRDGPIIHYTRLLSYSHVLHLVLTRTKRGICTNAYCFQGMLNNPGSRVPICEACKQQIRGAYVLATGLAWCPEHFVCAYRGCGRRLLECGFVEENGLKYCEGCFEAHIAPRCAKCSKPIISDCLNAMQKKWHPTCFTCAHCHKPFGNTAFYLENGLAYCEQDWNQLFTTKCVACKYPIEAGDRWVEALGNAFHSNCFNCTRCHSNLEGESFFAKNGQPYCKMHA
ncbi:hypothetical protein Y032_0275g1044 [Ancylostoma ceylanicum]|uniref:LIM zinc-binding domain-containing protein n=1 Tax=Ancylostoma ceylanicum TaxID=53326 RepID=A0A016S7Q3_9BILA|nr:hypothetical protein Y032_0275g1044 [Ancylostoma ceylanicum]